MGKTAEDLQDSKLIHAHLHSMYGFSPRSVLEENWSIKVKKLNSYKSFSKQRKEFEERGIGEAKSSLTLSGAGSRHGAFSGFPHKVVRDLLRFYLYERGEPRHTENGYFDNRSPTVLDPFCGQNGCMEDCYRLGLNYIGWDINSESMEANRQIRDELIAENGQSMFPTQAQIELVEGDSQDIKYDSIADLVLTSPPFSDIEDYGSEYGQIGKLGYSNFIHVLGSILGNCHRALKPNGIAVVEANDFRKGGRFYPLHADVMDEMRDVGFKLHDIIVIDHGKAFFEAFLSEVEHYKIMPKVHSYLIVAKKGKATIDRKETRKRLLDEANTLEQGVVIKQGMLFDTPQVDK